MCQQFLSQSSNVLVRLFPICACLLGFSLASGLPAEEVRRLSIEAYRDKMAGGWIGQMAGVGWGGPTEFKWKGEIIPQEKMPQWRPEMINQFNQDDIYVEMTFLRTLEQHGWDVSIRQAGIDFANSGYRSLACQPRRARQPARRNRAARFRTPSVQ